MVNYSQHAPCNIPQCLHSHCRWHSHMPPAPYNCLHSHRQTWEHHTRRIHSGNNSLYYHLPIHMHPPPPLPTQPPLVTCTHSHIASTATSDNSSNTPVTHALTTILFILLSFYQHPAVLTLPYWCSTFLNHTRCLMRPFSYLVNLFIYYLHFYFLTFISTSMQRRYSNFLFPYFCSSLWFLLPCNEDNLILSLQSTLSLA